MACRIRAIASPFLPIKPPFLKTTGPGRIAKTQIELCSNSYTNLLFKIASSSKECKRYNNLHNVTKFYLIKLREIQNWTSFGTELFHVIPGLSLQSRKTLRLGKRFQDIVTASARMLLRRNLDHLQGIFGFEASEVTDVTSSCSTNGDALTSDMRLGCEGCEGLGGRPH